MTDQYRLKTPTGYTADAHYAGLISDDEARRARTDARNWLAQMPADQRAQIEREFIAAQSLTSEQHRRQHLADMTPARRAELDAEWSAL